MAVESPKPETKTLPEVEEVGSLIKNVSFELSPDLYTGRMEYISKRFGKKIIKLEGYEAPPISAKSYNVIITRDTQPGIPNRGAFRVRYETEADSTKRLTPPHPLSLCHDTAQQLPSQKTSSRDWN